MKISKNFLIESFLIICIKLLLEYSYIIFIYPIFSYTGYNYFFNFENYLLSWFVTLLIFVLIYNKKEHTVSIVYYFIFLLYVIPNSVYFSLSNQSITSYLILMIPFIVILLFTINIKIYRLKTINYSKPLILLVALLFTLVTILHYFYATSGHMTFSLLTVYDFREQYHEISSSGIFGYLNSWVPKIFIILLLIWSIEYKKYLMSIFFFSFVILLFLLSGHKSVFSGFFLVFVLYIILRNENISLTMMRYFLYFIIILLILIMFFDMTILGSILIRRLLFVPPYLNFVYIEYFSTHIHPYWSDSFMKYFIEYPYDINLAKVIGTFLGHPKENANTGFIASGYAQGGLFGVILYTVIAIFLFNIIHILSRNMNKVFFIAIILLPILTLFLSSDFFTTLLTHGLIISIMVLYMYNNKNYILKFKNKKLMKV